MGDPKEPWTQTFAWKSSEFNIAVAELGINLAWLEARAEKRLIKLWAWQEQERQSWQQDLLEKNGP